MEECNAVIFDIKRFAIHDGDGIRTTIFFKGCPLRCMWCHNPEGISFAPEIQFVAGKCFGCRECERQCENRVHIFDRENHVLNRDKCVSCGKCMENCPSNALILSGKKMSLSEVFQIAMEDVKFYQQSGGGVTLSGGECLCQADFCTELLRLLKAQNINTAVDTSGYVSRTALDQVIPYTDMFLYDIKHIDIDKHKLYTGVTNERILDNLSYLNNKGKKVEIRIPIIPTVNDDERTIQQIGKLLSNYEVIQNVRILAYNNLAGSKYEMIGKENKMPKVEPPSEEHMIGISKILQSYGLNVVM